MKRLISEKKTIIFFAILAFIALIGLLLIFKADLLRHNFHIVYSKFQYYISYPLQKISSLKNEYADHLSTVEKLRKCKFENEKITHKLNEQSFIEHQNQELKKQLKFSKKIPKLVVTTRIISSSIDDYVGKIIIPVGKNDNLKKGMSVVSYLGVVGRIIDIGQNFSEVLLITDPNSRIVGFSTASKDKMIIAGLGNGELQANFVEENADIRVGDIIYTTGEGGYFPEGLPIGKIISITSESIIIEPMFDIQKLHYVQVIGNQISRQG